MESQLFGEKADRSSNKATTSAVRQAVGKIPKTERNREAAECQTVPMVSRDDDPASAEAVSGTVANDIVKNEDSPVSVPQAEGDQYIRKRRIIVGSSYCSSDAFIGLGIGSYFEFVCEPENPYDKNAIALIYNGNKIGYVSKADQLLFLSNLHLGRQVYGVITDVIVDGDFPKYEYEGWIGKNL